MKLCKHLSFSKTPILLLSVLILGSIYYDSAFAATDTKRPTISITSPASGSAVSETVTVTGTAYDSGSGVKKVEVKTGSSNYITATPKSPGNWSTWSISLNISGSTDIIARATDNAGNRQTTSITVSTSSATNTTLTVSDVSITEGNSGTKSATFTISRNNNLKSISVNYKTTDGTATSSDYTAISPNILSFTAGGSLSKTVTIPVKGDTAVETDETFFVDLENCTDCVISDSQGLGTIIDNDQSVTPSDITINDITVTEGNSGTKSATFTISRNTSTSSASVQYKTTDNTATSSDYTAISLTTLNFPVGYLSKTVTVPVKGDTTVETDETFFVDLSNCTGCNLVDSQGIGTITNNDLPTTTVSIDDVSITEGNSGTKSATFTITRSDNLKSISVNYKTTDGTASYSFSDYESFASTLSLPAGGSLTDTITVTVNGNNVLEKDETFFVDLSRCTGCDIIDSQGIGTIINDDEFLAPPQNSSRPVLITMIRGDVTNQQELVDVFKKYAAPSDLKFATSGAPTRSIYNQLNVNNVAFGLSLDRILLQSQTQQGESTYLGYDPEWFEGLDNTTPEAEYKDYVNSVRTASGYAHDNGFKFLLTPLYVDIQNHAREFAPYVDVVALQIPHYTKNYATAVQTAVQDIKSVNPDAIVLVQLIPKDGSSKQNGDPAVVIDAYNSVREHVDGVLLFYYESPNPVPVIEEFYQGIGMVPNQ